MPTRAGAYDGAVTALRHRADVVCRVRSSVAQVDDAFIARVAQRLSPGPPLALLDPAKAQVLDFRTDQVQDLPTVFVRYVRDGKEAVFLFALDDSVWSFCDADEAAQLVWIDLAESLDAVD